MLKLASEPRITCWGSLLSSASDTIPSRDKPHLHSDAPHSFLALGGPPGTHTAEGAMDLHLICAHLFPSEKMWPCLPIFPPQPCLSQGWHPIHVCSPATLTTMTHSHLESLHFHKKIIRSNFIVKRRDWCKCDSLQCLLWGRGLCVVEVNCQKV